MEIKNIPQIYINYEFTIIYTYQRIINICSDIIVECRFEEFNNSEECYIIEIWYRAYNVFQVK